MIIEDLYGFPTNDAYLISKIIRSLSTSLQLAIINLKNTHESNKLILQCLNVNLPFCPLGDFIDFKLVEFISKSKIYE